MGYEAFAIPKGPVFYAVEREMARRRAAQHARQMEVEAAYAASAEAEAATPLAAVVEPEPKPRTCPPTLLEIQRAACAHLQVSVLEFRSMRRNRRIADARAVAFWIARKHTSLSFPQIGRGYGRDHTTVLGSLRRTDEHLAEYAADIAAIEAALGVAADE